MHLRKTIAVAGAAVLAASLLGLTGTANAAGTPIGSPVQFIRVNGATSTPPALTDTVGINGIFKSGTASFAGSTYGCTGGTVNGTTKRGAYNGTTPAFQFTTMSITCNTPVGNATISVTPACAALGGVPVYFNDPVVNDGLLDGGGKGGPKYFNVLGSVDFPATPAPGCVKVSALGGLCSAYVVGTGLIAQFNEIIKTDVNGVRWQDLILKGTGSLVNQSGCLGLLTGNFTLNAITFNIQVTGGTTAGGGIDFRNLTR